MTMDCAEITQLIGSSLSLRSVFLVYHCPRFTGNCSAVHPAICVTSTSTYLPARDCQVLNFVGRW